MRNFLGFGQVPYIGVPYINPIKLGGLAGQSVPLQFPWLAYGASSSKPSINVLVDMRGQNVAARLQQIRSVYIDNMGSDNPIYCYFPDTQYAIVAKPNSAGWYPAYTNDLIMWVIGMGFTTANVPLTLILVSNLIIQPAVDVEVDTAVSLWRASPQISRGNSIYNTNFGVPALGDQFFQAQLGDAAGSVVNLFNGPFASGFIYLTAITVFGANVADNSPNPVLGAVVMESTGISGILFSIPFIAPPLSSFVVPSGNQQFYNQTGMQVKLDATQQWRLRQGGQSFSQGILIALLTWTYNPN